jgi:probable HAF family extracellular repeat protein
MSVLSNRGTRVGLAISLIGASACLPAAARCLGAPPEYEVTLLETFPGDSLAAATSINNQGHIAGYSHAPFEPYRAWVIADGELIDLGNFGGNKIETRRINEQGSVVGFGGDEEQHWHTLIWIDGEYHDLPTFGGPSIVAMGINESNHVVGHAQTDLPLGYWQAFLWADGEMTNLGTLGGSNSAAYEISNDGIVVGMATNPDIQGRAVAWIDGEITELEHPEQYPNSVAYAINQAGVIVGTVGDNYEELALPAKWVDGQLEYLATYPLSENANPFAINENGDIAGWSRVSWDIVVALLWHDGEVYELHDLVVNEPEVFLYYAWDINDHGQIVGLAGIEDRRFAYVATPVAVEGDLDGDGDVDTADLLLLLADWGCAGGDCIETGTVPVFRSLSFRSSSEPSRVHAGPKRSAGPGCVSPGVAIDQRRRPGLRCAAPRRGGAERVARYTATGAGMCGCGS